MKFNFEGAIVTLLTKHHLNKKDLWEKIGITRQGFDHKMRNGTWSVSDLASIAEFFQIEEGEFLALASGKPLAPTKETKEELALNFNHQAEHRAEQQENRLMMELQALLDQIKIKDKQLEAADRRMEGLQRTIDTFCNRVVQALPIG